MVWLMIFGVDTSACGISVMAFLKCSLLTCTPPAPASRNPSTRTYSAGLSRLRDHSNQRFPFLGAGARGEVGYQVGPALGPLRFGFELDDYKNHEQIFLLRDEDGSATDIAGAEVVDG